MPESTHLKKAPIKEAQINIKFNQKVDLKLVNTYASAISIFSKKENFFNFTQTITFGNKKDNGPVVSQEHIGYRLFSDDHKKGMIFTSDEIAFSIVENYEGWDKFKSEFDQLISELKLAGFSAMVQQVGLRFINKLSFDVGEDISKYLKILPGIPEKNFSSAADNLLLRYNVTEKSGGKASVNFIYRGLEPKTQKLLFDFDIVTSCAKTVAISVDNINEDLDYLRKYKNDIFFNSITEALIEKYNA